MKKITDELLEIEIRNFAESTWMTNLYNHEMQHVKINYRGWFNNRLKFYDANLEHSLIDMFKTDIDFNKISKEISKDDRDQIISNLSHKLSLMHCTINVRTIWGAGESRKRKGILWENHCLAEAGIEMLETYKKQIYNKQIASEVFNKADYRLPPELGEHIGSFMSVHDLVQLLRTSKSETDVYKHKVEGAVFNKTENCLQPELDGIIGSFLTDQEVTRPTKTTKQGQSKSQTGNNSETDKHKIACIELSKELDHYIEERSKNKKYTGPFKGIFGSSKKSKLSAAFALKNVLVGKMNESILSDHKAALSHGKLGKIYKKWKSDISKNTLSPKKHK